MFQYSCLNPIAQIGLDGFDGQYEKTDDVNAADVVLVRSAAMHDMELSDKLCAIARAGAGVNNIPLDKCADQGIVVFNTPGANANGVKELVLAGMLLAARDIVGGVNWASMEKLLQEGDYTRTKKKTSSITGVVSTVYWCVAAAVYLACSLPGHSWRESWVIWPVAGVLFAAVMAVCSALAGRKK